MIKKLFYISLILSSALVLSTSCNLDLKKSRRAISANIGAASTSMEVEVVINSSGSPVVRGGSDWIQFEDFSEKKDEQGYVISQIASFKMDCNRTGENRETSFEIESNTDILTITIKQFGETSSGLPLKSDFVVKEIHYALKGESEHFTYDQLGRISRIDHYSDEEVQLGSSVFTYESNNRLVITDRHGSIREFEINNSGNIVSQKDGQTQYSYQYGDEGSLSKITCSQNNTYSHHADYQWKNNSIERIVTTNGSEELSDYYFSYDLLSTGFCNFNLNNIIKGDDIDVYGLTGKDSAKLMRNYYEKTTKKIVDAKYVFDEDGSLRKIIINEGSRDLTLCELVYFE